ncbi:MAG TPA: universal stress protein, partial [Albitalea sp.]
LAAAREHRCDMIVMATHGRGVVAELLWGSHTREVVTRSEVPVLVVH